jgi:prepilin-type processing-associated H-X9-DG protein
MMAGDPTEQGTSNYGMIGMIAAACMALIALIGMLVVLGQRQFGYAHCTSNVQQLALALTMYATDYNNQLPEPEGFEGTLLHSYVGMPAVIQCPDSGSASGVDYVYLGAGLNLKDLKKPGRTILIHDKIGNHNDKVNCGYADGSVQSIATTATTWEAFRKEREAAGDVILNEPADPVETPDKLPTYQQLD